MQCFVGRFVLLQAAHHPLSLFCHNPVVATVWAATLISPTSNSVQLLLILSPRKRLCKLHRSDQVVLSRGMLGMKAKKNRGSDV